jgi:hypothetical protein
MNDRRLKPCFTDYARASTNLSCGIGIVKNHHGGIIQTAETLPKETCESPQFLTSVSGLIAMTIPLPPAGMCHSAIT